MYEALKDTWENKPVWAMVWLTFVFLTILHLLGLMDINSSALLFKL